MSEPRAARGGVWFDCGGGMQLHVGVDPEFAPGAPRASGVRRRRCRAAHRARRPPERLGRRGPLGPGAAGDLAVLRVRPVGQPAGVHHRLSAARSGGCVPRYAITLSSPSGTRSRARQRLAARRRPHHAHRDHVRDRQVGERADPVGHVASAASATSGRAASTRSPRRSGRAPHLGHRLHRVGVADHALGLEPGLAPARERLLQPRRHRVGGSGPEAGITSMKSTGTVALRTRSPGRPAGRPRWR